VDRSQFASLMEQLGGAGRSGPGPAAAPQQSRGLWDSAYPWTAPPPAHGPAHGYPGQDFSAGQVFERYDANATGKLELDEVRRLAADIRSGRVAHPGHGGDGRSPQRPSLGPWAHSRGDGAPPGLPAAFGSGDMLYGGSALASMPPSAAASPGRFGASASLAASDGLLRAYRARMASLSAVHARLMAKREAGVHQLARLGARREEVASARRAIERETLADSESVLHRLRSAEALKQSLLAHEADAIAADVRAIDGFTSALMSVAPAAGAPPGSAPAGEADHGRALGFMRAYPELCADADRLLARPMRTEIEVSADDLERETATRAAVVRRHRALLDLLSAKDAIIHLLLREREAAASRAGSAHQSSAAEVRKWVGLAEQLAGEVRGAKEAGEGVGPAAEAARVVDLQARALAEAAMSAAGGGGGHLGGPGAASRRASDASSGRWDDGWGHGPRRRGRLPGAGAVRAVDGVDLGATAEPGSAAASDEEAEAAGGGRHGGGRRGRGGAPDDGGEDEEGDEDEDEE